MRQTPRSIVCSATLATVAFTLSAAAGDLAYWDQSENLLWHTPLNWNGSYVPYDAIDVSINPYFAPDDAQIYIASNLTTAVCRNLQARDWNCPPFSCNFNSRIEGLSIGGGTPTLLVLETLSSRADDSQVLGDGESNLTLANLRVRTRRIEIREANGADATMLLDNVDGRIIAGGSGIFVQPFTGLFLSNGTSFLSENGDTYAVDVAIGSVLQTFGATSLQNGILRVDGSLTNTGSLTASGLNGVGTIVMNAPITINGLTDSTFIGSMTGIGSLTWNSLGTLELIGSPKTFLGDFTIASGMVEISGTNQLGAGALIMNGGALRPYDAPITISDRSIMLSANGGRFDLDAQPMTISTALTGSGTLTKSGASILALHAPSTYGGDTFVDAGTLQANNATGSATGGGAVHVADGATLAGTGAISGTIETVAGATVRPGIAAPFAFGTLHAHSAHFDAGSVFAIDVDGAAPGTSDRLALGGALTIDRGATLRITLPAAPPRAGSAIPIVTAASIDGTFDVIDADVPGDWCVEYGATEIVLHYAVECDVINDPCPADTDDSGSVDFTDLLAVLGSYGACAGCPADTNGDDTVDFTDIVAVLSAWGPCPE